MVQSAKLSEQHDYGSQETVGELSPITGENVLSADGADVARLPSFERHAPGFNQTARLAGRLNASAISKVEHDALLAERGDLLQRKYQAGLTKKEENRLAYVRWSLDRIEDARNGARFDVLDDAVSEYEDFLKEMRTLNRQISNLSERGNHE